MVAARTASSARVVRDRVTASFRAGLVGNQGIQCGTGLFGPAELFVGGRFELLKACQDGIEVVAALPIAVVDVGGHGENQVLQFGELSLAARRRSRASSASRRASMRARRRKTEEPARGAWSAGLGRAPADGELVLAKFEFEPREDGGDEKCDAMAAPIPAAARQLPQRTSLSKAYW